MIIGIDASALTLPHQTGVQRYTEYIIKYLLQIGGEHQFRLYAPRPLPNPFATHQVIIKSPRFWTQLRLPLELYLHRPDVFFQPSYMLPPFCPIPAVISIHDLAWLKFPTAYSSQELKLQEIATKRLVRQQAAVIVPSEATLKDCQTLLKLPSSQLHLIPEGLIELPQPNFSKYPQIQELREKDIILAIGRLEKRKNQITLIKALQFLQTNHRASINEAVLVLLGQPGYGAEEVFAAIQTARANGITIIHRKDATDEELASWLKVAKLYVYPSLYEGFGLPILQAFAAQVPVITAQNSAIPEVAGNASLYIKDPMSEEELAAAINSLLHSAEKRQKLIDAGLEQLKKFSWEHAAHTILNLFTDIARQSAKSTQPDV